MKCVHCLGECLKHGHDRNGRQRFRCTGNGCKKTFTIESKNHPATTKKKRLAIHLLLAGCEESSIALELNIEIDLVKVWASHISGLSVLRPKKQLLGIKTLLTIYNAIEKGRISKINYRSPTRFR